MQVKTALVWSKVQIVCICSGLVKTREIQLGRKLPTYTWIVRVTVWPRTTSMTPATL